MFRVAIGILLILAAVSSDCDGACVERAMSVPQMILTAFTGFGLILWPMVDGTFNNEQ
jgi:hypothetical protein